MAGHVLIGEDVAAAIGPVLSSKIGISVTSECRICRTEVSTAKNDDVSVIVERFLDVDNIVFSHVKCANSQIVYRGETLHSRSREDDLQTLAVFLPSWEGARAVLLLENENPLRIFTPTGDVFSDWVSNLLQSGWSLMTGLGKRPAYLRTWSVLLDPLNGSGSILTEANDKFLDNLPVLPPPWVTTAMGAAEVTLIAGDLDLDAVQESNEPARALHGLAKAGRLVSCVVPVKIVKLDDDQIQKAGRSAAGKLEAALHQRARRVETESESRHQFMRLPDTLVCRQALAGDFSLAILELHFVDESKAQAALRELASKGFPSGANDGDGYYLKTAPTGWAAVIWPSQIRVFAARDENHKSQFVFAPFETVNTLWYENARDRNAVGLLVCNNLDEPHNWDSIIAGLKNGDILGAGLPAMCAH